MKSQVNPVVAVAVVIILVAAIGFYFFKQSGGRSATGGKMDTKLDTSRVETDPVKLQQKVEESLKKNGQTTGR